MNLLGMEITSSLVDTLLMGRGLYILHLVVLIIFLLCLPLFYRKYIKGVLNNKEKLFLVGATILFILASLSVSQFKSVIYFDEQQYVSGSLHMIDYFGFFNCMTGSASNCTQMITIPHGMAYSFFGSFLSIFAGGDISLFEHVMKSLNLLFSALSIAVFYFLIKALFGKRSTAKIATLLFATSPVMLAFSSTALTEPSSQFFLLLSAWIAYMLYAKEEEASEDRSRLSLLLLTTLFFAFSNRGEMIMPILPFLIFFLIRIKQAKQIIIVIAAYAPLAVFHLLNYSGKLGLHSATTFGGIYLTYWFSGKIILLSAVILATFLAAAITLISKKKLAVVEGEENSLRFLLYALAILLLTLAMFSTIPFKDEHRFIIPLSFVPYLALGAITHNGKMRTLPAAILLFIVAAMMFSQAIYAREIISLPYYGNTCNKKQFDSIRMLDSLNDSEYAYSYPVSYLVVAYSHKTEIGQVGATELSNISFYVINNVYDPELVSHIDAEERVQVLEEDECGYDIWLVRR